MKILIYTFRTFPWIDELKELFPEVFIFGKLNEDFEKFCEEIKVKQPDLIMGVARGRKSVWESKTVNQFHGRKIIKGGAEEYEMFIPNEPSFPINQSPRTTFCNWKAYKIKNFVARSNLNTKLCFVHTKENDLQRLKI